MPTRIKILASLLVFVIIGTLIVFSQRSAPTIETQTVKIGVMAPLSGPAAELGEHVRRGLELAVEDVDGRYELVFADDKCTDTAAAQSEAEKFTTIDGIRHVIGPLCAGPYQSVASLFNQRQTVFLHTSAVTTPFIEASGDFGIPGLTTTLAEEDAFLAKYIYKTLGLQKMALITWNQTWAQEHRAGFTEAFTNLGGEIVFDERVELEETDFRTTLLKLSQTDAEGVFIVSLNFQNGLIVKQLRESGSALSVFGQFEIEDPAFLANAGEAANGVTYVYPHIDRSRLNVMAFEKTYRERYGSAPNYYASIAYDALMLYDWAIDRCGVADTACVASKIMRVKEYPGVSGLITMNSDKTLSRTFVIKTFVDNEPVILYD